jgi:hypothetical protein
MSTLQTQGIDSPQPLASPIIGPNGLNGDAGRLEIHQPDAVEEFLAAHDFLLPLIEEARAKIAEYFGAETPLTLAVRFHPDDGTSELFLYIKSALPVVEAREVLDRLAWDWWLDEMPRAHNRMMLSLGYA